VPICIEVTIWRGMLDMYNPAPSTLFVNIYLRIGIWFIQNATIISLLQTTSPILRMLKVQTRNYL
jgi:hypothetical protein